MKQPIRIDFVSDIACPWCAVGLSSLQLALSRLGDTVDAEIVMHPFELNPQMGEEGEDLVDHISKKYGRTPQQVAQAQDDLRQRGADVGFTFGKRSRIYSTFDAHRLMHWAGIKGKQVDLKRHCSRLITARARPRATMTFWLQRRNQWGLTALRRAPFCKEATMPMRSVQKKRNISQWVFSQCRRSSLMTATC